MKKFTVSFQEILDYTIEVEAEDMAKAFQDVESKLDQMRSSIQEVRINNNQDIQLLEDTITEDHRFNVYFVA